MLLPPSTVCISTSGRIARLPGMESPSHTPKISGDAKYTMSPAPASIAADASVPRT